MTDVCGFEDLSDAEKVQFARAENAAILAYIDELLGELDDQTGRPSQVGAHDALQVEDVTGRVDRLSATASLGGDSTSPARDSSGPDPAPPDLGPLVPRLPTEPS